MELKFNHYPNFRYELTLLLTYVGIGALFFFLFLFTLIAVLVYLGSRVSYLLVFYTPSGLVLT